MRLMPMGSGRHKFIEHAFQNNRLRHFARSCTSSALSQTRQTNRKLYSGVNGEYAKLSNVEHRKV
jgi:hypothetical protein